MHFNLSSNLFLRDASFIARGETAITRIRTDPPYIENKLLLFGRTFSVVSGDRMPVKSALDLNFKSPSLPPFEGQLVGTVLLQMLI